ncbi:hypothetical protein [Halobacillus litoralis]|uniref:hypothetical protein n=1 Tax=Halobacillus litoralis TaxID=45668 RepID=UPI001CD229BF|nr:hypothetical protein [Halobacillus litoralis]MCA1021473.1 hypothetical protein [Halobacillus litoralis]
MNLYDRYSKELLKSTNGLVQPDMQDFVKMAAFYEAIRQEEKNRERLNKYKGIVKADASFEL